MTRIYQQYQRRISFLSLIVIAAWCGLGFRLFNIQVVNGNKYSEQGNRQGQTKKVLPALRGNIFDINGNPFTRNVIQYTICADPSLIQNKYDVANTLSKATGKSSNYYVKKLSGKSNFTYLDRNLEKEIAQPIVDKNYDGIIVQRHARRTYPHENIGGQLIGFTNVDDKGLVGIEEVYNQYLSGTNGWIIKQRSGLGNINQKNSYPKKLPIDGADIQLTINLDYQSVLQEELLKQLKKTDAISATGVMINPQTGAILAMASVPDFNPNKPNKSATENQKIRAIADQFEPGSTFKIVAATAAIDNNIVQIDDEFNCENGSFKYKTITIGDHQPHDILTFGEIVENSSNIGIIKVASKVGEKLLHKYARNYGFGVPTNLGLGSESHGTLRKLNEWSTISSAEIAMGHEVGTSMLQLAMAYGAIANGGILMKPYIINNIINSNNEIVLNNKPRAVRKVTAKNVTKELSNLLVNAVERGTGIEANIHGWQVAGKTGTAQKFIDGAYSHTKYISNFVGYLPANNPQILCAIMLDEPKMGYHWGGTGAAPVFKQVLKRIINLDDSIKPPKNISNVNPNSESILVEKILKKTKNIFSNEPILLSSVALDPDDIKLFKKEQKQDNTEFKIPNVKGMSLKKAINTLNTAGFESKFSGSGLVIWQSPKPGIVSREGTICSIGLE